MPPVEQLERLADALIARQRRELTSLTDTEEISKDVRERLSSALAKLPEATGKQDEAAVALLEVLWARVAGRDTPEQCCSLLIASGIAMDAITHYVELVGERNEAAEDFTVSCAEVSAALTMWFESDPTLDDRLAMWARRVAGDTVVWTREVLGIEPGMSADSLSAGAEAGAEAVAGRLFAEHSRRMNELKLAA